MDVSPTRSVKSGRSTKSVRKDNSKVLPKLSGQQDSKQTIEATVNADKSGEQKSAVTKSPTQTKIPLKRTPTKTLSPKVVISQRTVCSKSSQMKSVSKVSLPLKDTSCKKLEQEASKLSFRTHAANNTKGSISFTKPLTARPQPGFSKRSASTISYKSLKPQKSEPEAPIPTLSKVSSIAGDHESHSLSARERVAENNKVKVFETMQKKLQEMQSDFIQKYENLKITCPEKVKTEFKFISMIRNDECKLLVKEDDLLRLPKKLPVESVNNFKEKVKAGIDKCMNIMLENLKMAQQAENEFERNFNLEETHAKIMKEQTLRMRELNETINVLCSSKNTELDLQIVKMQKEIQDGKKVLQLAEKKLTDSQAEHVDEVRRLEKDLKEKYDGEIIKRDIQVVEATKKLKAIEKQYEKLCCSVQQTAEDSSSDQIEKLKLTEEVRILKETIQSLTKKLTNAEQHHHHDKKDKQDKAEQIAKLENDLEAAKKKIEELRSLNKCETAHNLKEKLKEIGQLKSNVETLEKDKAELLEQIEDLKVECNNIYELRKQLHEAEERMEEMHATVEESERMVSNHIALPQDIHAELEKLRQSETEKRREIEKLKVELSKAHFNICQLEEQIQRDQQLLEVRSELINSLQTNDNSQRIHLEEMFAQVGEKNNTINEVGLNNELRTKSEEFRNLFTTLSTKQMELTRQEHMIKLLEESNDRSQMLRVKQEEKIGRMEEEIAQLKQTIGIYQNNVLGNAGCKNLLFTPVPSGDEYNENFYYYTSERRRKRQVDINVKKYET